MPLPLHPTQGKLRPAGRSGGSGSSRLRATTTQAVADEIELRNLPQAYAAAIDRRDVGGLLDLFLPDARLTVVRGRERTEEYCGHEEIPSLFDAFAECEATLHEVVNHDLALDGTEATGEVSASPTTSPGARGPTPATWSCTCATATHTGAGAGATATVGASTGASPAAASSSAGPSCAASACPEPELFRCSLAGNSAAEEQRKRRLGEAGAEAGGEGAEEAGASAGSGQNWAQET